MAISQLLFGRTPKSTKIGEFLVIDATISLATNQSAEVSNLPIEKQEDITDHIRVNPLTLTIEGFISNAPLDQISSVLGGLAGGALGALGASSKIGGAAAVGTGLGAALGSTLGGALSELFRDINDSDYPKKAMEALLKAQKERKPFSITTFFSDTLYKNMVITDLDFPQDKESGDGLRFTMTTQQVELVTVSVVPVPESFVKGVREAQSAASTADKGKQSLDDAEKKASKSKLLERLEVLGVL